jgi:hypothetical protein
MKPYLLLFPILSLTLLSCDKESSGEDTLTDPQTRTTLITQKIWVYDNSGLDVDKNGTIDAPLPAGTLQNCTIDNTLTFSENGQGVMNEGPTKCNANDPSSLSMNWNFSSDETLLNIGGTGATGLSGQFKLLALTDTKLSITKDSVNNTGKYTFIVNLKH